MIKKYYYKRIIVLIISIIILNIFLLLHTNFNKNINLENLDIGYYNGTEKLNKMPQKDNDQNLVFDYASCDNDAYIIWDNESWAPLVKNLKTSKTKCSIYFKEKTSINICNTYGNDSALCYISKLGDNDYVNMAYDHASANGIMDNNLRYIGTSPSNYIDIGDRDSEDKPILWRVIGIMNNIKSLNNDDEKIENLIKIIRAESIGQYSWDTSDSNINGGWGINEWSQADAMKLLNPQEVYNDTPEIGKSLYWNKDKGNCFSTENSSCDFTSSGISEEAKNKIAKVRWNIGTFGETYDKNKVKSSYMYNAERSNHNGKELCVSIAGEYCNDNVNRTTIWDGYIGLLYPSDYGYAIGENIRTNCLGISMYLYGSELCAKNNWLNPKEGSTWTMTSMPHITDSVYVFRILHDGGIGNLSAKYTYHIWPVAYLKSSIKILPNSKPEYGSQENPFIASV